MTDDIPRGIEVLLKKASVDPEFRALLLEKRAEAAESIGLELTAAEALMVDSVPAAQLEATIAGTRVAPETRRIFLGKVAAAMLAAIAASPLGCDSWWESTKGTRPGVPPDEDVVETGDPDGRQSEGPTTTMPKPPPPAPTGIRPHRPPSHKE